MPLNLEQLIAFNQWFGQALEVLASQEQNQDLQAKPIISLFVDCRRNLVQINCIDSITASLIADIESNNTPRPLEIYINSIIYRQNDRRQ